MLKKKLKSSCLYKTYVIQRSPLRHAVIESQTVCYESHRPGKQERARAYYSVWHRICKFTPLFNIIFRDLRPAVVEHPLGADILPLSVQTQVNLVKLVYIVKNDCRRNLVGASISVPCKTPLSSGCRVQRHVESGCRVQRHLEPGSRVQRHLEPGTAESNVTLSQDADSNVTLSQDADSNVTLSQDADSNVTLAGTPTPTSPWARTRLHVTLSQDAPTSHVTLSQDADSNVSLSQDADSNVNLEPGRRVQRHLSQDAESNVTLSQEADSTSPWARTPSRF